MGQLDFGAMEKEILAELNSKISSVDVNKIIKDRVESKLSALKWQDQINKEIEKTVDNQVETALNYWL